MSDTRLESLGQKAADAPNHPRTLLLTACDPPRSAGGRLGALLKTAGANLPEWDRDAEAPPRTLDPAELLAFAPELILLVPDAPTMDEADEAAEVLADLEGWWELPGVCDKECYLLTPSWIAPDQEPAETARIFATILNPETFTEMLPAYAVRMAPASLLKRPEAEPDA